MKLWDYACKRWHRDRWTPKPSHNRKDGRVFLLAVWCYKCQTIRYLTYWKCQSCGQFFLPKVYAEQRHDCQIVTESHGIVHMCPPDGRGFMPCCGRTPFEVPRTDRITKDKTIVTCGKEGELTQCH